MMQKAASVSGPAILQTFSLMLGIFAIRGAMMSFEGKAGFRIVLCIGLALASTSAQSGDDPDPAQTHVMLNALMSVSNSPIPSASSCAGNYGQRGRATVKDVLSTQLAYLYRGDNKIIGSCKNKLCKLSVEHAAGEDVFAADISFKLENGKALVSTLECVLTP